MTDRTDTALGIRRVVIEGKEYELGVKIGDMRKFTKEVQKKDADRVDVILDWTKKFLIQGDNSLTEDEASLLVELNIGEISENIPLSLGLTTKKQLDAVKNKEELKN